MHFYFKDYDDVRIAYEVINSMSVSVKRDHREIVAGLRNAIRDYYARSSRKRFVGITRAFDGVGMHPIEVYLSDLPDSIETANDADDWMWKNVCHNIGCVGMVRPFKRESGRFSAYVCVWR